MSNKKGFINKLKLCMFILTSATRKNMLTVSCDFCGSTNIIAHNQSYNKVNDEIIHYQADYTCMNCKASCVTVQNWERKTKEHITNIISDAKKTCCK